MTIVGLGSVSDYCLARSSYATIVVKPGPLGAAGTQDADTQKFKVCVCVDDSDQCIPALQFAASNFLPDANTEIHVVSVAAPSQFPVNIYSCANSIAQIIHVHNMMHPM